MHQIFDSILLLCIKNSYFHEALQMKILTFQFIFVTGTERNRQKEKETKKNPKIEKILLGRKQFNKLFLKKYIYKFRKKLEVVESNFGF